MGLGEQTLTELPVPRTDSPFDKCSSSVDSLFKFLHLDLSVNLYVSQLSVTITNA